MGDNCKTVMNRSLRPAVTPILLMLLFAVLKLWFFFVVSLAGLLAVIILYLKTPQHILMKVYEDRLELFDVKNRLTNKIQMEDIKAWRWSNGAGGAVEIYYEQPGEEGFLCTVTSQNAKGVADLLNKRLKEKNQNLAQYGEPYRAVADKIRNKGKRVDKDAHS